MSPWGMRIEMILEACRQNTSSLQSTSLMTRILSCLMEHLYTEKMVEDCEHRLLELQYFISRDWK